MIIIYHHPSMNSIIYKIISSTNVPFSSSYNHSLQSPVALFSPELTIPHLHLIKRKESFHSQQDQTIRDTNQSTTPPTQSTPIRTSLNSSGSHINLLLKKL
ncbi:hypothetical protein Droror1_Dr00025471 [Drosera rotundifolia]